MLVDVFDISRGLVGERKRGLKRWECLDIASPRREKLEYLAVDVENLLCVMKGSSSNRLGVITLTGSCSGSLKA
jgi:hypothetical protein